MDKPVRILIVDDQARARQSLRALLLTCSDVGEIQEAKNGLDALQQIDTFSPDIVFMDARMPGLDGIAATQVIKCHAPKVKVIVWSMYCDYQSDALAAGADAFICKDESPEELFETLDQLSDEN